MYRYNKHIISYKEIKIKPRFCITCKSHLIIANFSRPNVMRARAGTQPEQLVEFCRLPVDRNTISCALPDDIP